MPQSPDRREVDPLLTEGNRVGDEMRGNMARGSWTILPRNPDSIKSLHPLSPRQITGPRLRDSLLQDDTIIIAEVNAVINGSGARRKVSIPPEVRDRNLLIFGENARKLSPTHHLICRLLAIQMEQGHEMYPLSDLAEKVWPGIDFPVSNAYALIGKINGILGSEVIIRHKEEGKIIGLSLNIPVET